MKRGPRQISAQQAAFVRYWLADRKRNTYNAAIKAGYAPSAARGAHAFLHRPAVKAEITRRTAPAFRKLEITADRVLQELASIAYSNILDFGVIDEDGQFDVDLTDIDRTAAAGIAGIETETVTTTRTEGKGEWAIPITTVTKRTKLKLVDRRPALEALGRHLKILGGDQIQSFEPIRLILEHAPPLPRPQPLRIEDLVKDGPK